MEPWEVKHKLITISTQIARALDDLRFLSREDPNNMRGAGVMILHRNILREAAGITSMYQGIELWHPAATQKEHCLCSHAPGSHTKTRNSNGNSVGRYRCNQCHCLYYIYCDCLKDELNQELFDD